MRRYGEAEIAAEEERIGARLPDELRKRFLEGVPEEVVLCVGGEPVDAFSVWGPSTQDTDTKGRPYMTPGMHRQTEEVRGTGQDFLSEEVLVAWAQNAGGDLAVVLRYGRLGWWELSGGAVEPVEVVWDPSPELMDELENG
jgi:hypothetical protein